MNADPVTVISDSQHRASAVSLFNYTWTLLDKTDRTPSETDEMVRAAYASRWHWGVVGERINFARGEWQVSRCCAEAGRSQAAIHHANLYMDACKAEDFGPFDLAFAHEGLARAFRVADRHEEAAQHTEAAREVGKDIESDQDRAWLFENLM